MSTFVETAPTFVQTAPTFVQTAPSFVETAPSFVETAPTFVQTAPTFLDTAPTFAAADLGVTGSFSRAGFRGADARRRQPVVNASRWGAPLWPAESSAVHVVVDSEAALRDLGVLGFAARCIG